MEHISNRSSVNAGYIQKIGNAASMRQTTGFSGKLIMQSLDSLVQEAIAGANPLSFEPVISLECPTNSGGKFWRSQASHEGITIWWGKISTNGGMKKISRDQCQQNNPVIELRNRALGKLAKGYDIVINETRLP